MYLDVFDRLTYGHKASLLTVDSAESKKNANFKEDDIKDESLLLILPDSEYVLESSYQYIFENRQGTVRCLAFFNKAELMNIITENSRVDLNVAGRLTTGRYFYGTDSIRITSRQWQPWWRGNH